jgi:DNA-binding NtrC family response regulator
MLLEDMLAAADAPNLTVITDGYLPREIAGIVDLLSPDFISADCDEARLRHSVAARPRRTDPKRYVTEAGGIHFATYSPTLFPLIEQLTRVAVRDVVVLIVGETGTGKTTLARLMHQLSPRRSEPFQNVACGTLPSDLIESELFGHVRGAFTGADRSKIGRFEAAGRGTLLLDEIDVLGPKEQSKLLRVIETGEYELVGSTETRTSKARLITASNVDLETLMEKLEFRSDLYYRLNVLEFKLPPLRERASDIVPLALEFIDDCCRQHGIEVRRIHRDFLEALKQYRWPGNIRELKNQVQRAVLFCENGDLNATDLSESVRRPSSAKRDLASTSPQPVSLSERLAKGEREIIEDALRAHNGNRTKTARSLGMSRVGLYKKMRKHGMLETAKTSL